MSACQDEDGIFGVTLGSRMRKVRYIMILQWCNFVMLKIPCTGCLTATVRSWMSRRRNRKCVRKTPFPTSFAALHQPQARD